MKNKKILLIYLISFVLVILNSCSKQSDNLNAIPEDAIFVTSFDVKSLVKKAKLNDFEEMNFYKFFETEFKNENPEIAVKFKEILDNPLSTGIDFLSNSYLFVVAKSQKETYLGFTIGLRSSTKFEEFITDFSTTSKMPLDIEDITDFKVLKIQNNRGTIIGWDDEKLLILNSIDDNFSGQEGDKIFKDYYKKLITQEKSNSIVQNSSFKDFNKNSKDISTWLSLSIINKIAKESEYRQISQTFDPKLLDESYLTAHLEFNNGEINLTYKGEYDDKLIEQFANENIIKDDFDTKLLEQVSAKQYFVLSFGLLLNKYYENLQKLPQFAMLGIGIEDEFEKNLGISIYDLLSTFDGDFLVTLNDIQLQTSEQNIKQDVWVPGFYDKQNRWHPGMYQYKDTLIVKEQLVPIITLCTSFNNKDVFTNLMSKIPPEILTTNSDYYEINLEGVKIYSMYKDGILIFSNGLDIITKVKSGGYGSESLADDDLSKNISDNYSFMFLSLDYENYPAAIKSKIEENISGKSALFSSIIGIYDNLKVEATDLKNVKVTIKLKTDDENSLFTIIDSFDKNMNDLMQL